MKTYTSALIKLTTFLSVKPFAGVGVFITVEAMSSCLINTAQLTTNVDRQLLIAFVVRMWRVNLG